MTISAINFYNVCVWKIPEKRSKQKENYFETQEKNDLHHVCQIITFTLYPDIFK